MSGSRTDLTSDEIDERVRIIQSPTSSLQEIIEAAQQIGASDMLFPQGKDESRKEWEDRIISRFMPKKPMGPENEKEARSKIITLIMRIKNRHTYTRSPLADPNGNAMKNIMMHAPEMYTYSTNPSFNPKTKGGYRKKHRKTHRHRRAHRKVHRRSRKN